MGDIQLLVLADPAARYLAMLDELPPEVGIAAGNTVEAFANTAPAASAILNCQVDGALLRQLFPLCPNLRWVHTFAAGLDRVLFPELVESAVPLTNGSGTFSEILGEYAMAAILFFAKDMRRMVRSQEAGIWDPFDVAEISRQTLGVVGYGDIGRSVAARARALGMRVFASKRRPPSGGADAFAETIFPPERHVEMLSQCHYVVVATPLTPETRGLLGETEIRAMRPDAVLINLGRGPVIDEAALLRALEEKRIKGAALDVFDQEPLPAGHPFYGLGNVLLSAHCADRTDDFWAKAMRSFLDNFERFRKGEPLRSVADKRLGY